MKRTIAFLQLGVGGAALVIAGTIVMGAASATSANRTGGSVNTDMLANVLSTAFLAQNVTVVCAEQNKWFSEDTRGSAGDGREFAEHVKGEVLARLNEREAGVVVIGAAKAARAVSLGLIHVMDGGSDLEQGERLTAWCETTAKPLVKGILAQHDVRHDLYDRMLSQSKE